MPVKAFFDTNILIYLLSTDSAKADQAERLLQHGGVISVQVLNELTNVIRRKIDMTWQETDTFLQTIKALFVIEPLTVETHEQGLELLQHYKLSVYDAMIVAAALQSDCDVLYSEDMQHGLHVESRLLITNPFID